MMVVWAEAMAMKAEKASASAISFAIVRWLCELLVMIVGIYIESMCTRREVVLTGGEVY